MRSIVLLILLALSLTACNPAQKPPPEATKDGTTEGAGIVEQQDPTIETSAMIQAGEVSLESDMIENVPTPQAKQPPQEQPKAPLPSPTDLPKPAGYKGTILAGTTAPLLDFTQADYDGARKSGKVIVLYFYAEWCPVCEQETKNALYPAFNELTRKDVIGFRVNYKDDNTDSNEEALAREFGIGYQHTKVILKNDTRILKAPDSWDKARYLNEITKAL